jgi:hypothetical protein
MRVWSKKFYVYGICMCFAVFYIVFKTNQFIGDLNTQNEAISDENFVSSDRKYEEFSAKTSSPVVSQWKVLSDGTVTHLGNYSDDSLARISFVIRNDRLCDSIERKGVHVIVFVVSEARNFLRRQTVRDTWAHKHLQNALPFTPVFVLGVHANREEFLEVQVIIV